MGIQGKCGVTSVNKNELKIIRGTTNTINLTIIDDNGDVYNLKDGEKVIFGVKQNPENTDYDIQKIITVESARDGNITIKLSPEDTQELPFGRYFFDIGIQTADGDYCMVVPFSPFIVENAVTRKE